MNPYLPFVEDIVQGLQRARKVQVSAVPTPPPASGHKAVLFSPHPDDECITGVLPLRLMREAGFRVINVPVTFGSNRDRQAARAEELANACGYLGWACVREADHLEPLDAKSIRRLLERFQPTVLMMPHARDWNARHVSTHNLVVRALGDVGREFTCTVVETEFWGAMDDPNLMVEADTRTVADLVAATSLHAGEVARNPYHLLLPAWMQDNVRRGGELVGGQGATAPDYAFATLYRLSQWRRGAFQPVLKQGVLIPSGADALRKAYPWK